MKEKTLRHRIKICLWIVITGLALSGITAFPLESELAILKDHVNPGSLMGNWIDHIYHAIKATNTRFPWLSYGTDWLAFAHLVIAVVFVGPLRDPVKNIWVIHFGMIACIGVFPLAFIAGSIRGIPFFWQLIDCSFGVIGLVPLYLCHKYIRLLEAAS
ncbi:hypothetical protein [Mucilaginibacter sp.]|uniref:hypothetical protein n=1 Tax=Mucilaginibacter sp. TaxID=1882438 RepID=UPI002C5BF7F5|nr:hypothetical protein [Mucilaginibacter sp.]HTI60123.1 hypothetical protein [Mucilaginibacter sp.]